MITTAALQVFYCTYPECHSIFLYTKDIQSGETFSRTQSLMIDTGVRIHYSRLTLSALVDKICQQLWCQLELFVTVVWNENASRKAFFQLSYNPL